MPDTITLFDADGNPVEVEKPESPNVKQMRERIKELEGVEAENTTLKAQIDNSNRQAVVAQAGLQLDDTKLMALRAVHSGEWTPEAIRETAANLGWASPPPPLVPSAEADAMARMNAAHQGGSTTTPNPEAELDARLAAAKNEREFLEIYHQSGRAVAQ